MSDADDTASATPILNVEGLTAGYGDVQVLTDVDLTVDTGEVVTMLGPNGAGKSTLMNSIYGFATVTDGRIALRGKDVTGADPADLLRGGVGYVMQDPSIFPKMSVDENLVMGGFVLGDDDRARERVEELYDDFERLDERSGQRASTLSGGERRLLEIARTLLLDPELVLFDEPSIGLEPSYVDMVFDRIESLDEQGKTVLVVEQNADVALDVSDRGYVISDGEIRFEGSAQRLLEDEDIGRLYLGG